MSRQKKILIAAFTNNQFTFLGIKQTFASILTIQLMEILPQNDIKKTIIADIIIFDIETPDDLMEFYQFRKIYPKTKIIILINTRDKKTINRILRNNVQSIILKTEPVNILAQAIEEIHNGNNFFSPVIKDCFIESCIPSTKMKNKLFGTKLTVKETEVLKLIVDELTTTEIAEKLSISTNTVESHRKKIMQKFNCKNVAGIVKNAILNGYID